ncbi:MAG: hypothetical protein IPF68_03575 [Bacteroidales bacterium]|nr:hypothetical protein [Bacteroidales bacterium]
MGRCYKQLKQYDKAISMYELIHSEKAELQQPWIVRKDLPLAWADMYIAQAKYKRQRNHWLKAIPLNSNGKLRTRIYFILGQINQLEKRDVQAGEYYTKVIKALRRSKWLLMPELILPGCTMPTAATNG